MNLSSLERFVPAKLYNRGVDYFERDYVQGLKEEAPNHWYARVEGTDLYHVSVYVNNSGTILSSSCTCPFDSDSLCKHEVAVCLAISHYIEENGSAEIVEVDVLQQLKSLKKTELLELLKELVEQQPAVKTYLTTKFSVAGGMDEATARRIIRKAAARGIRRGFIEWDETNEAVEGAWEVYDYTSELNPQQDGEKMIRLYLVVAKECSVLLEIADDSSGVIGNVISVSLDSIGEVMEDWSEELDDSTADRMLELIASHMMYHLEQDMTDAPSSLVYSVMQWCERVGASKKIYDFIENIVTSEAIKNKTYGYEAERLRLNQLEILRQQKDGQALEAFIKEHHQYPAIRKAEVQRAMKEQDFEGAIRLCEAYEQLDANLPGLVDDWKMLRFEAYEKVGRESDMIDLAFDLAASGKEEYYQLLKEVVPAEAWPETVESLLSQLGGGYWQQTLYVNILINEGMTEKLLDHCRSNLHEIETLYPHLIEQHPHEVNEVFISYIYHLIQSANGRKQYKGACSKIKKFKKALGAEAAASLIEEIKFTYPKRPALLDELAKI